MSAPRFTDSRSLTRFGGYPTNGDHIADELRRLRLLVRRLIQQTRRKPPDPLDAFKGLVLSDEQVAGLLADIDEARNGHPDVAEDRERDEELVRLTAEIDARRAAAVRDGTRLALLHLAELFRLTPFEERCLVVGLASEVDRRYEQLFAYLQDDVTRKKPTVDLALNLLCDSPEDRLAARALFAAGSRLIRHRLLHVPDDSTDGPVPLPGRTLTLDERIAAFLLGDDRVDARLGGCVRVLRHPPASPLTCASEDVRTRIRRLLEHSGRGSESTPRVTLYLHGPPGSGRVALAQAVGHDLGRPILTADVGLLLAARRPFDELLRLLCREAVLQSAVLCVENIDPLLDETSGQQLRLVREALHAGGALAFMTGRRPWRPSGLSADDWLLPVELPLPGEAERQRLWQAALDAPYRIASDVDAAALAARFRFTPGQIRDALIEAHHHATWRNPDDPRIDMADLTAACRAHSNQRLGTLALKIQPRHRWDELVLPREPLDQLRGIVSHFRLRHRVHEEWGFGRKQSLGRGLNALFAGPSGTGKTLAAEVIAGELALDLYKIDLSQVVSKYIGETEKNLDRVFREAETSNAILFFDEADALFGKRSEVKDAHDRYANIETGYLLQKMEEYDGVAILATNLRANLDEAFARRMAFIVEFPFPDEEHRDRIWRGVWPPEVPLADDVDCAALARMYKVSGGHIKNIALAAAFLAADENVPIAMHHLARAARREFQKVGRAWEEPTGR